AREVARMPRLEAREADLGERLPRARKVGAEGDLLVAALAHEEPTGILEEEARATAPVDASALRREQPRGELRERRLPRAVRPREREALAAAKLERRAVEHRAVVRERDLVDVADDVTDDRYLVRTRYRSEPRGSVLGEPGDSIVAGSIEDDPPRLHEDDARRV